MAKQNESVNSTPNITAPEIINSKRLNVCGVKNKQLTSDESSTILPQKQNIIELGKEINNLLKTQENFSFNQLEDLGIKYILVTTVKDYITDTKLSCTNYFMFMNESKKIDLIIAIKMVVATDETILKNYEEYIDKIIEFREIFSDKQPIKLKDCFKMASLIKILNFQNDLENLFCGAIIKNSENFEISDCTLKETQEMTNLTSATYIGPFDANLET